MNVNTLVSVLLPCYNAENYVRAAIESMLKQTYPHFELIVIDDASTDKTADIIQQIKDTRIRLIQKPVNTGYTDSLNMGLSIASGKYIARMDADDICEPKRFENQVNYLEDHPDCILCGCRILMIPQQKVCNYPVEHDAIVEELFTRNSFAHPGVMMRKSVIDQYKLRYDRTYEPTEDYELWTRMMMLGKLHNIPEVLLQYRIHEQQISREKSVLQQKNRLRVRTNLLQQLSDSPLPSDLLDDQFPAFAKNSEELIDELKNRLNILEKLSVANKTQGIYPEKPFGRYIKHTSTTLCLSIIKHQYKPGLSLWFRLWKKVPRFFLFIGLRQNVSFTVRCVIHSVIPD